MNLRLERFPIGTRFGMLVVTEHVEPGGSNLGKLLIRVRCDCGTRLSVEARKLIGRQESNRSKRWKGRRSCGCEKPLKGCA